MTLQKTREEMSCFEVLLVLFRGLKSSPVVWTSFIGPRDKYIAIFARKYLNFFY